MGLIARIQETLAIAMYNRDRAEAYAKELHAQSMVRSSNASDCTEPVTTLRAG